MTQLRAAPPPCPLRTLVLRLQRSAITCVVVVHENLFAGGNWPLDNDVNPNANGRVGNCSELYIAFGSDAAKVVNKAAFIAYVLGIEHEITRPAPSLLVSRWMS